MIEVKFVGRLGNQLFQYAFIYAAAKKLNTSFYIDTTFEGNYLEKYFQLPNDPLQTLDKYIFGIKGYKNFFGIHLKRFFYKILYNFFKLEPIYCSLDTPPREELKRLKNRSSYNGFFQSELYFTGYEAEIKQLFTIKQKYTSQFNHIAKDLPSHKKLVAIHIRRGDYVNLGSTLPIEYFHQAITSIHEVGNLYVIISDDPKYNAEEFSYLDNLYISKNEEIIDFQFLIHANECILSSSTFSWWGAYLNKNSPKVIAPKNWLGAGNKEWPHSIMLKDWIKI
ncbi:MAG: hypothetical protein JWN56_1408 [Sphingobacteriales bacterium]|nr:hypothetical protein [Sphingobacteriales bacterium]